jgi:hypothetical protein
LIPILENLVVLSPKTNEFLHYNKKQRGAKILNDKSPKKLTKLQTKNYQTREFADCRSRQLSTTQRVIFGGGLGVTSATRYTVTVIQHVTFCRDGLVCSLGLPPVHAQCCRCCTATAVYTLIESVTASLNGLNPFLGVSPRAMFVAHAKCGLT